MRYIHRLCNRHLHIIHISAIPNRLKDGIGESEKQNVLSGLFSKIVINAINLALVETAWTAWLRS